MLIGKNVKSTVILSVYSQDILGVKIALDQLIRTRKTVFVKVDTYTNLLKNQGQREDVFLFFDITNGPSCITIDSSEREIFICFSEDELEQIVKDIHVAIDFNQVPYKGIRKVYIAKKKYALLVCNMQSKHKYDFTSDNVKGMMKEEIRRLLEEDV